MFPEKHVKDLKSSRRKTKLLYELKISILFFASFVFIGPFIHEMSHLILLEVKNCTYLFDIGLMFPNGVHAEVKPLCAIKEGFLLFFYSIGYLNTLLIGVALNIAGSITSRENYSHELMALGTGMLLSAILTIGIEGDIQNALEILQMPESYGLWITLLVVFGVLAASLHGIEELLNLERKE